MKRGGGDVRECRGSQAHLEHLPEDIQPESGDDDSGDMRGAPDGVDGLEDEGECDGKDGSVPTARVNQSGRRGAKEASAYQGTSLSIRIPTRGPNATPAIPTRPNRPMMSLRDGKEMLIRSLEERTSSSCKAPHPGGTSRSPKNLQSTRYSRG